MVPDGTTFWNNKDELILFLFPPLAPVFAWEAFERGNDIHLQADPTKLELLHQNFEKKKVEFKKTAKDSILDKYGGQEHLEAPPKQLLLAQTVSSSICLLVYVSFCLSTCLSVCLSKAFDSMMVPFQKQF